MFVPLIITIFAIFTVPAYANSCESPKYSSSSFSTTDGFFHYSTTYIVEFALQCSNNAKDIQFYAVINGKSFQVTASEETSKYQVSWQLENSQSGSQTFDVKIYDEDKYSQYQKAEAEQADTSSVEPLFTISHYHGGLSKKTPISPEFVFLALVSGAVYYAYAFKTQLKN